MTHAQWLINGVLSLLCAGALSCIVLGRRIHEGPVIKSGLILMIVSLLVSVAIDLKGFDATRGVLNAALLLRAGIFVVALGVMWRLRPRQRQRHF